MDDLGAEVLVGYCGGREGRKESNFEIFIDGHLVEEGSVE